ncbi:hypothetical protein predicted by Glimmer/Critica [Sorangium cellulosum So ce56]|uniref:Uncharacterized protein n=1 Tax=Sorangium cellulosum (strain So ce56) TaxID=448385 RepID=A9GGH4_SORC5|nr:hypothetical protein predicted by Glimmer/Critica [Sorangium cellulosum So ce56]
MAKAATRGLNRWTKPGGLGSSARSNPVPREPAPATQASPRSPVDVEGAQGGAAPAVPIVRAGSPPPLPGPGAPGASSPRAVLLAQLTEMVRAALAVDDLEAARVANEALGKLLATPEQTSGDASDVVRLSTERARRG